MPMTPEKTAAQRQLDDAVEALVAAYDSFDQKEVIVGYTIVITGARYSSPEYDEEFVDGDEENMVSRYCAFYKAGQQPTMTRGMLEAHLDRYRYQ